MKPDKSLRELITLLFGLVFVGLVTVVIISTFRRNVPSDVLITAIVTQTTIKDVPTTEIPYPEPVNSITPSVVSPETESAVMTSESIIRTRFASGLHITPFFEPTGIYDDGQVKASGNRLGLDTQNSWFGFVDGNDFTIYAGALLGELDQGAIHFLINYSYRGFDERILTPTKHGGVRVVSEQNNRLKLFSTDGTTYYFDLPARRFVDSLTEVVPTATPLPTYTPFPPPPTFSISTPIPTPNPYPAPTGQSMAAP